MKLYRMGAMIPVFFLILSICGCKGQKAQEEYVLLEDQKLVIYTAHKKEIYEPIIKEFEERSGIWVQVVSGGTNQILDQIATENGENSGDVMFGGGVDSLEAYSMYFQPYRCSRYDELDHTYVSPNDSYTVFSKLPIVFIYNNKLVISAGTPRSWEELLNSRWQGKIAFADPAQSGSSYTELLTMTQILSKEFDEDEILQAFAKNLAGNISAGSATVVDEVIQGERLVGITYEEIALRRIAMGADIGMVYPAEGTSAVPDGCAIIKNAPHEANAELFLEFIVSEDVQHLLEDQLYRRSVRKDMGRRDEMLEIAYDLQYSGVHRDEILERWAQLMQ